jgi:Leucine rich repeat/Tetratricopeptide repeat
MIGSLRERAAYEALAEARRRISTAQSTHAQALNLTSLGLPALPAEIGQLINLRTLSLGGNTLTRLSPAVSLLTNLLVLSMWDNMLTKLPDGIGQLTNLQVLDVGFNVLARLPTDVGQLTNLRELNVPLNGLSALPAELGQLTNLRGLKVSFNRLTALPAELGQLTSLQRLDLSGNRLTALPAELGQLTSLQRLDLSGNRLAEPLPTLATEGTQAVLAYLRTLRQSGSQYQARPSLNRDGKTIKGRVLAQVRSKGPARFVRREIYRLTWWLSMLHLVWNRPERPGALTAKDLEPEWFVRLHWGKKGHFITAMVLNVRNGQARVLLGHPWSLATRWNPVRNFDLRELGAAPHSYGRWHKYNWVEDAPVGVPSDRPPHFFDLKRLMRTGTFLAFCLGIAMALQALAYNNFRWDSSPWFTILIVGMILIPVIRYSVIVRPVEKGEAESDTNSKDESGVLQADDTKSKDESGVLQADDDNVAKYRKLAFTSPDRYRLNLAISLSELSDRFCNFGLPADAVRAAEEAVDMYRKLAAASTNQCGRGGRQPRMDFPHSPERYRSDLAYALSELSARYCELDRPADAVRAAEEAVDMYRKLAAASPDHYGQDLACSLARLTAIHEMLGQGVQLPLCPMPQRRARLAEAMRIADLLSPPRGDQAESILRLATTIYDWLRILRDLLP